MSFANQFISLMRKNAILWIRNLCGSLCEIIFPTFLVCVVILIRWRIENESGDLTNYIELHDREAYITALGQHSSGLGPSDIFADTTISTAFQKCYASNDKKSIIGLVGVDSQLEGFLQSQITNSLFPTVSFHTFDDEEALEDYVTSKNYDNPDVDDIYYPICVAIVVESIDIGNEYLVKLRYDDNNLDGGGENKQDIPSTRDDMIDTMSKNPDLASFGMYRDSGFTYLENLILNYALRKESLDTSATVSIGITPMKTPEYVKDEFLEGTLDTMPFFIFLSFIAPVFRLISMVVSEKETKVREGMKMMGLKDSTYWFSWFTYYSIINIVISIIQTVVLRNGSDVSPFNYSNFFLLFFFFFLYGYGIFSFGLFLAAFFHKARIASIVGLMIYFATYLLSSIYFVQDGVSESMKNVGSLLPVVAVTLGTRNVVQFEMTQTEMTFSNCNDLVDNYRFSSALLYLLLDFFLYLILALYLDNIIPSPYGVKKPFYYFLTKSYWTGKINKIEEDKEEKEQAYFDPQNFEEVSAQLKTQESNHECLKIFNLIKNFSNGVKAVDRLSVSMYKNQIFALLGHNGAGKTTTIAMLTGLLEPSSGSARVYNLDVFKQMNQVRQILGICPQHDVLFEKLTPKEHLEIFAAFKGMRRSKIKSEVTKILKDVDLEKSMNHLAKNLSGGQKRKLSVGIAFIGDSPLIMLDEPTSGMDLSARRGMWNMLKNYKTDKIVILTTHFMDEADYLGDRIGIMSKGGLRCLGSSLFLKKRFGVGYNLTMAKEYEADPDIIEEFVNTRIDNCRKLSDAPQEIIFQLPFKESNKFKEFFEELDAKLQFLKVESYGISVTTLEEVFLKVAKGEDELQSKALEKMSTLKKSLTKKNSVGSMNNMDNFSIANPNDTEKGSCNIFQIHFSSILLKRFLHTRRNFLTLLVEILVPLILIIFGLVLTLISTYEDGPVRWFEPTDYPSPQKIYVGKNSNHISDSIISDFISNLPSSFDESAFDYSDSDKMTNLISFDEKIFEDRSVDPKRYGSYYFETLTTSPHEYEGWIFANLSSQDSSAAFVSYFGDALLKTITPGVTFKIANHPLPLTFRVRSNQDTNNANSISFMFSMAFALVPASVISFIVREREENLKHQQLISGVSLFAYWISNFAMDIIKTMIPALLSIVMIFSFGVENDIDYLWLLVLEFSIIIVPFTYMTSFLFKKENTAQNATLLVNILCGTLLPTITFILRVFDSTRTAGKVIAWICRIIPSFAFSEGIMNIANRELYAFMDNTDTPEPLEFNAGGQNIMMMAIIMVLSIIIHFLIEAKMLEFHIKQKETNCADDEDSDVIAEEKFVSEKNPSELAVSALKLKKVFRLGYKEKLTAVENVSFHLNFGDCFALLGTNGAGKTTTFKMLTSEETPSAGRIFIKGMDLKKNFSLIRKYVGYCPQFDALFFSLTVKENLEFYSKIKGIRKDKRAELVRDAMTELDLTHYEKILAGKLSGGNKRKLAVAISLLGNPPIIFMDEPSTGMDPKARRFMWEVIARVSTLRKNSAVILTTHSMEEAEALSTKMGIMVNGKFKCFGSGQHIKSKFGTGYELEIKVDIPTEEAFSQFKTQHKIDSNTKYNRGQLISLFKKANMPELENELCKKGSAADFFNEFENNRQIVAEIAASYILQESVGKAVFNELLTKFDKVDIIEHYNAEFKFRVPKLNFSIGYIFGYLQELANIYNIEEYSASQTTLEQIFNAFAQERSQENKDQTQK